MIELIVIGVILCVLVAVLLLRETKESISETYRYENDGDIICSKEIFDRVVHGAKPKAVIRSPAYQMASVIHNNRGFVVKLYKSYYYKNTPPSYAWYSLDKKDCFSVNTYKESVYNCAIYYNGFHLHPMGFKELSGSAFTQDELAYLWHIMDKVYKKRKQKEEQQSREKLTQQVREML